MAADLGPGRPAAAVVDLGVASLEYCDFSGTAQRYRLDPTRPRLLLGRSESCDLVLDWDDLVSREHARLEPVGENWAVVDDGLSRNGTYVNGERLAGTRRLAHGDRLLLGATVLAYRAGGPPRTPRTATGGPPVALTEMQRQVLRALVRPLRDAGRRVMPATNRQIAAELCLSVDTVKDHLSELFGKLRVAHLPQNEKRLALANRALDLGLV